MNHKKFLGYDKDEKGNLIIDNKQAKAVRRIAKELEEDKVPKWDGSYNWHPSNIQQILTNEKYKGDALLQKTYLQLGQECVIRKGDLRCLWKGF